MESLIHGPLLAFVNSEIPRIINFTIFALVLYFLLRKPVGRFLRERVQKIVRDLQSAHDERETSRAKLKEIEARLNRLADEIDEMKTNAASEADAEEKRIRAAAQLDAEKLKLLARREIEGGVRAAELELKAFAAREAVQLAKEIIRSEMKEEDHQRLIERFNQRIGEVGR